MEVALMDYIMTKELHLRFPHMWAPVAEYFEKILTQKWRNQIAFGRESFIALNRTAMCLYMPEAALDAMEEAIRLGQDPEVEVLQPCVSSNIGLDLYSPHALKLQYLIYVSNAKRGVRSLVDHNFDSEEVEHFNRLMLQEGATLLESGHQKFDKKQMLAPYVGIEKFLVPLVDINDQWKLLYQSTLESILISNCTVPRYPWDDMVFGKGRKIEGVPSAVVIPDKLVTPIKVFRTSVLVYLESEACEHSTGEWIRVLRKQMKTMKRNNKTFDLDWTFLCKHVEDMITANVEQKVLACFPDTELGVERSIAGTAAAIEKIKVSPEVLAVGPPLTRALSAAIGFLLKLEEGLHPETADIGRMSVFQTKVVHASASFVYAMVNEKQEKASPFFGHRHLFGRKALEYLYQKVSLAREGSFDRTLKNPSMKELRIFKFLLDDPRQAVIKTWLKTAAIQDRNFSLGIEDAPEEEAASDAASASAAAPTALALAHPLSTSCSSDGKDFKAASKLKSKEQAAIDEKASSKKKAMLKLFGAKVTM